MSSEGKMGNFRIQPNTDSFGVTYDYSSIMHYVARSFSRNSFNTKETIDPQFQDKIGKWNSLSEKDAILIDRMYNCQMAETVSPDANKKK